MNNDWFVIKDFKDFIDSSRRMVFNHFGSSKENMDDKNLFEKLSDSDQKELDEMLSHTEAVSIVNAFVKRQKHKKTKETRYLIDENSYIEIINALNDRLVSNILNSLVNKGLIETAYDDESDDFVFWIKDNDKNS